MHHYEDARLGVSNSELISTAFAAMLYLCGHVDNACQFMKQKTQLLSAGISMVYGFLY